MKDVKKFLDGLTDEQAREALQLQQRLNTLDYQTKSQDIGGGEGQSEPQPQSQGGFDNEPMNGGG